MLLIKQLKSISIIDIVEESIKCILNFVRLTSKLTKFISKNIFNSVFFFIIMVIFVFFEQELSYFDETNLKTDGIFIRNFYYP